jgi:hypothetical protein
MYKNISFNALFFFSLSFNHLKMLKQILGHEPYKEWVISGLKLGAR